MSQSSAAPVSLTLVAPEPAPCPRPVTAGSGTDSRRMRDLHIVQAGDAVLRRPAKRFSLPAETEQAERVVEKLFRRVDAIRSAHTFSKGTGLAAPQIGIRRRAAVVVDPGAAEPIVLINPEVIEVSTAIDEPKFEGCLSFFDVRGRLARPLSIRVRHELPDGTPVTTVFERSTARLVAHEIDHLDGILYVDRMAPGDDPIPVKQYRGTGAPWKYN